MKLPRILKPQLEPSLNDPLVYFNFIKVSWGLLGPQRTLTADIFVISYIFLVVKSLRHLGSER